MMSLSASAIHERCEELDRQLQAIIFHHETLAAGERRSLEERKSALRMESDRKRRDFETRLREVDEEIRHVENEGRVRLAALSSEKKEALRPELEELQQMMSLAGVDEEEEEIAEADKVNDDEKETKTTKDELVRVKRARAGGDDFEGVASSSSSARTESTAKKNARTEETTNDVRPKRGGISSSTSSIPKATMSTTTSTSSQSTETLAGRIGSSNNVDTKSRGKAQMNTLASSSTSSSETTVGDEDKLTSKRRSRRDAKDDTPVSSIPLPNSLKNNNNNNNNNNNKETSSKQENSSPTILDDRIQRAIAKIASRRGRGRLLKDLYLSRLSLPPPRDFDGFHLESLIGSKHRKSKCRLCERMLDDQFYSGTTLSKTAEEGGAGDDDDREKEEEEEEEVRCSAHRFCETCGRSVWHRFAGKCPGMFWGNSCNTNAGS